MRTIRAQIISGYLGSGKTTLVRRLLSDAHSAHERVAFISNELGDLGIDRALLGGTGPRYVELAGGCVCCALDEALRETLLQLRDVVDPDRVVIETSGEAIPHDVQLTLFQPPISSWITEESVTVVVNAEQLAEGRDLDGTFAEQLDSADIILLNHADRIRPPHTAAKLAARLGPLAPGVAVLPTQHADVDTTLLFGSLRLRSHAPRPHRHSTLVHEILTVPDGLTVAALEALSWGAGCVRLKGFVRASHGIVVIQGVGRRVEVLPLPPEADVPPALLGRVVCIRRR